MNPPRIVILLATYNGALHLPEQLESLEKQTVDRIDILVSDDGSTDATLEILAAAAKKWRKGRFDIVDGPRAGFAENFRSLILRANPDADFFAFCDQDDRWDSDKLETAIEGLVSVPASTPGLYGSATRTITEDGEPVGTSPIMRRPPSFQNALVQSIAGGNTMVMNRSAMHLLQTASRDARFVSHDWWAYLLVTGAGGSMIYDATPHIHYRQHATNLVGANSGVFAKLRRLGLLVSGRWFDWIDTNMIALEENRDLLTEDNRRVLGQFSALRRNANPLQRLKLLRKLRLYRQTMAGDLSMMLGVLIGRF